mmetsp:Transcript_29444/g.83027  ORF Transcript_29444/g.83027 Transcript_29444/m.83027 type:complete len:591 (-) Transcript_29444:144-1916(-)|eukprot:CAMPEP_0117669756 /NCGR_PEP_ID=MMETSP0804-20121206/12327_1 /TAXON_ID=1074897 /ORGANISM="Tetraselmis astigmatica, Strain CCMP880" /LENGTH=590 /DNA_ID=CAMNT_0005477885 /DNA_START=242 /DNA_END=2014 /DNA_ORIENTATION=-
MLSPTSARPFRGGAKLAVADLEDAERGRARDHHPKADVSPHPHKTWLERYSEWLEVPVHSSTIALFRMLYALCVLAQLGKWWDMFEEFNESYVMFPYAGLPFVRPLSLAGGHILMRVCAAAAVLQLLGLGTAVATPVMWFSFSWMFNMCESNHNNHYLLMTHLTFVGSFVGWGRWMSLDQLILSKLGRRRDPRVPRWHLQVIRLIFCIPYFFGAIAKMNSDWLFRAQPLTMWFKGRGGLFDYPLFPWFIAWSGMVFDLVISFLLWYRPTRYLLAFPASLTFNISNKLMFNIGIFPMMMIASLILFLEPHHPAQLVAFILRRQVYGLPPSHGKGSGQRGGDLGSGEDKEKLGKPSPRGRRRSEPQLLNLTARQWWSVIFFTSFVAFHALNPLRHFVLYPSNPSWTEEGHFGAWHMKLRTKRGFSVLELTELSGKQHLWAPEDDPFINANQRRKIGSKPHEMILYVQRLKMVFEAALRPLKSVHVISCFSLNGRPKHQLYIPSANLLDYVGKYEMVGYTAVGKWLYGDEQGPTCSKKYPENYSTTLAHKSLSEIHAQAGIFSQYNPETHRKQVKRRVAEGIFEDAYTWPMFE